MDRKKLHTRVPAYNHYCSSSILQVTVHLDEQQHNSGTFIPRLQDHEDSLPFSTTSCSWSVMTSTERGGEQRALLQGLPLEKEGALQNATVATVKVTDKLGHEDVVETGSFHILTDIRKRQPFKISVAWQADTPVVSRRAPKVRILIPTPGQSGRETLSYRKRCFVSSAVSQNVTDAMHSIRGEAQLASFSSMTDISEFVAANDATLEKFPYQRPLNLSQPHRIGLFLNQSDVTLLSMQASNNSACELSRAVSSDGFELTGGPCASLRVTKTGRAVVEFGDCSRPMLSLMSFRETSGSDSQVTLKQCSELTGQVLQLTRSRPLTSTSLSFFNATTKTTLQPHGVPTAGAQHLVGVIAGSSCAGFVILCVLVVTLVILVRRQQHGGNNDLALEDVAGTEEAGVSAPLNS